MPTPVAHTLAGASVALAGRHYLHRHPWLLGAGLVAITNFPDVDFIPGYLVGEPRAFHWGATHSFAAALAAGLVAGALALRAGWRFAPIFGLVTAAYATHVVMDMLLGPGAPSRGLEALWPFTRERYMAPHGIFLMAPKEIVEVGPVAALFSPNIIPVVQRELMIMLPVCAMAWLIGRSAMGRARGSMQPVRSNRNPAPCDG